MTKTCLSLLIVKLKIIERNFEKLPGWAEQFAFHFNILQFCPSLPYSKLPSASISLTGRYFCISLDLVAIFQSLNLAKFRDITVPFKFALLASAQYPKNR